MIKKTSIDRVIDTVRIEEVVGDFVRLKRRGSGMQGLCPFHNEKTPSFSVNPTGNFYKCFGCGKGGNSVNFIMDHEKMSFPEAIRYLAEKYGIPLEEDESTEEDKIEVLRRENILSLMQYATKYYDDQLYQTDEGKAIGLSYFKERGFLESTIKAFSLGYAPNERFRFTQQALKDGFELQMLKDCGLTNTAGNDFFYNRVMFTIQDMSGRPVAFAGRIMGENNKGPKYINSPETEIYKKSYILYGLYQARTAMRKEDICIVVEGYTDVLSMYQAGIENVVASSGTALTEGQLRQIKRFTTNVLMLYDGDNAGINAATRAIDLVHEQDMQVQLVLLPEKNDPDSFVKSLGAEGFKDYLIEHAMDFISFRKYVFEQNNGNDPLAKSQIIKEVIGSIAKIPDAIKRSLYIKECSASFDMEEGILVGELNTILRKEIYRQRKKVNPDILNEQEWISEEKKPGQQETATPPSAEYHQERDLLRILICYGDQWVDEEEEIDLATFVLTNLEEYKETMTNQQAIDLFELAQDALNRGKPVTQGLFTQHENESIQTYALDIIASPFEYSENWSKRWGLELQTQVAPDKNFIKDATQAILRYKQRKIRMQQKLELENIIEAEKKGDIDLVNSRAAVYRKLKTDDMDISEQLNSVIIP